MIITIRRDETITDAWGNVISVPTTFTLQIEDKDLQYTGKHNELEVTENGTIQSLLRVLYLRGENKEADIKLKDEVEAEGKVYKVVQIRNYSKHKEIILYGLE